MLWKLIALSVLGESASNELPRNVRPAHFPREALLAEYPWPQQPRFAPFHASLDGGGKGMIKALLDMYADEKLVMLEIGGFLGGSMRSWLSHAPQMSAVLLEVDYFGNHGDSLAKDVETLTNLDRLQQGLLGCCKQAMGSVANMRQTDGAAHTLFSNLWDFRHRLAINFNGFPAGLVELHQLGFVPDIIFIDTDKHFDEIWVAHTLWPGALLAGDDWTWVWKSGPLIDSSDVLVRRARDPVMRFAKKYNYTLLVQGETWIVTSPHTSRELWRRAPGLGRVPPKHWVLPTIEGFQTSTT